MNKKIVFEKMWLFLSIAKNYERSYNYFDSMLIVANHIEKRKQLNSVL